MEPKDNVNVAKLRWAGGMADYTKAVQGPVYETQ